MLTGVDRTLPLFEGVEPAPTRRKGPSKRALRTRLWKAALAFYLGQLGYDDLMDIAGQLSAKENEQHV